MERERESQQELKNRTKVDNEGWQADMKQLKNRMSLVIMNKSWNQQLVDPLHLETHCKNRALCRRLCASNHFCLHQPHVIVLTVYKLVQRTKTRCGIMMLCSCHGQSYAKTWDWTHFVETMNITQFMSGVILQSMNRMHNAVLIKGVFGVFIKNLYSLKQVRNPLTISWIYNKYKCHVKKGSPFKNAYESKPNFQWVENLNINWIPVKNEKHTNSR